MTDVLLFEDNDGGNIEFVNGTVTTSAGLEQAAYLSMFGGNDDDSGRASDNSRQWWGNIVEPDPKRRYRSETQYMLRSMAATTGNLKLLQDAVARDLSWMVEDLGATVSALATIPAVGRVAIEVNVELGNSEFTRTFVENWGTRT